MLVILGLAIARDIGRSLGPGLFRRLDPATAGTVGFLIRLATVALALVVALRVAGIEARTLALGGAFTAVILGLAAQQTLGNLIAGTVLLSARPFHVGDRVRLQGGPLAGQIEGTVSSLGLLYTTFANGDDSIMVPNSVVLNVAVLPIREPEAVHLRARLSAGMTPIDLQEILEASLKTPLRGPPRITLEELDGEEVVVRIAATPSVASQGRHLASELLGIVAVTRVRAKKQWANPLRSAGRARSRSRALPAARVRAGPRAAGRRGSAEKPARRRCRRRRVWAPARETAHRRAPRASSSALRWGPPSQSRLVTAKRSRSSASAARRSSLPSRSARMYSICACGPPLAGRLAARRSRSRRARADRRAAGCRAQRQPPRDDACERFLAQPVCQALAAALR